MPAPGGPWIKKIFFSLRAFNDRLGSQILKYAYIFNDFNLNYSVLDYQKNEILKTNLIYKMITLLLYQKSTKLTLKNVFFIKAHILFSILPSFFLFFFFLKALIHDLILLIKKQKLLSLYYNIIMRKIFPLSV